MKARRFMLLIAVVCVTMLCLGTSAAADPPKEDYYFRWGEFLDYQDCGTGWHFTGNAAHYGCEYYKVKIVDATATNALVNGTFEFWFDHTNYAVFVPEWDWWRQAQFQGRWRIQPNGIDGYWEGTMASVGNGQGGWYEPISHGTGRGYGELDGWLIKTTHWYEPDDGTSPYDGFWPVNWGVIIAKGKK